MVFLFFDLLIYISSSGCITHILINGGTAGIYLSFHKSGDLFVFSIFLQFDFDFFFVYVNLYNFTMAYVPKWMTEIIAKGSSVKNCLEM